MKTRTRILQLLEKNTDKDYWLYTDNLQSDSLISCRKQNVHEILGKLEEKGYVERKVGRPGIPYKITDKGRKYYYKRKAKEIDNTY